jgi:CitB family two-component system response regulator CitT
VVTTAEEAIKSVAEKDYDVVLLDVVLQKTRGTDILEEIKMARPEAAVILVSGRSSEEAYEEGIKKGAFDYLVKPVQIERLIETMNKAVDSIKGRQR